MSDFKRTLAHLFGNVQDQFDLLQLRLKQRYNLLEPIAILPYRGHGNERVLHLKGRVLERSGLRQPTDKDTAWQNLVNMYRRFNSDEIAGAHVRARFAGDEYNVFTDDEGFFDVQITPSGPLPADSSWHTIELELITPKAAGQGTTIVLGEMLVPPVQAAFGIISDIDDTIVRTDVPNMLKMARTVMLHNAYTRLPFKGVAAFYQALHRGVKNNGANPIFYVSSSPWNLYDLLDDFFRINDLPKGPLLLRDYDLDDRRFAGHAGHKLERIMPLMDTYPTLPFVLIGDSGQEDPEIYRDVVRTRPQQVRAIYIRDVTGEERRTAVQALIREVEAAGIPMLFVRDTVEAAVHAAERGLIDPAALPSVREEKVKDEQAGGVVEQVLDD